MPQGIRRARPAADEDVIVTHYAVDKTGVRVFRAWHDATTGARIRDDNGQGPVYTWAQVATIESQGFADKLRRLGYKLMGANSNEADAAVAAEDVVPGVVQASQGKS